MHYHNIIEDTEKVRRHGEEGFTLLELSIVIIVIGLIIGSILVGRDLIHSAAVRGQISQFEKYKSAVNTFRTKYNNVPGDIPADQALAFGFAARAGTPGQGDGNGFVEGGGPGYVQAAGETVLFWNDLSTAGLIDVHAVGHDCTADTGTCLSSSATIPVTSILPPARINSAGQLIVYGAAGFNYFNLIAATLSSGIDANGVMHGSGTYNLTPAEFLTIDTKIDDGYPLMGALTLNSGFSSDTIPPSPSTPAPPAPGVCITNATNPPTYNVQGAANAETQGVGCNLQLRF